MAETYQQLAVWYYAAGSEKRGPFCDEEMQEFLDTGIVHADTLVWKESLPSWQQFRNSSLAGALPGKTPKSPPPFRDACERHPKPPPYSSGTIPLHQRRSIVWMLFGIISLGAALADGIVHHFQPGWTVISRIGITIQVVTTASALALLALFDIFDDEYSPPPKLSRGSKISMALWVLVISLLALCAHLGIRQAGTEKEPQTTSVEAKAPSPSPDVQPATPSPSVVEAVPAPTPTSNQEVNSSNPIIYTGSFINGSTGDNGTLTLKVEHLIRMADGQIAIGGELITENSTLSITGTYSLDTNEILFSPGIQSQTEWKGRITGECIKGIFTRHQSYGSEESGIWEVRHSGGGSFQKDENTR